MTTFQKVTFVAKFLSHQNVNTVEAEILALLWFFYYTPSTSVPSIQMVLNQCLLNLSPYIQDHGDRMEAKTEKMQAMFTKDLQELKIKQTTINNKLEGIHSRITEAEAQIHDLEDRMLEITAT